MPQSWRLKLLAATALLVTSVNAEVTASAVQDAQVTANYNVGQACCNLLRFSLGSLVSFPQSQVYDASVDSLWTIQAQAVSPACIVSPTSTSDVSKTLSGINLMRIFGLQCQFAVKSGGHTPWAGAASIPGGITIDLAALNQVTVSQDKTSTGVGPGNRWVDVYSKLDALGLAVLGGRDAAVGVGGLVTGGGISFFSPRYGFVCDNVINHEVVLYDGSVINVNANSRPDLWVALKGGSNNFGIVTRFDLKTFAQGKFWGGQIVNSISTLNAQLAAFVNFTAQPKYDIYAALINSYSWSAANGGWIIASNLEYTQPVVNPPVFQQFTAIPQLFSTMRISNLSDFTIELDNSNNLLKNQIFYTSTYSNDLPLLTQLFAQSNASLQAVVGVPNLVWSLSLQPLVTAVTKFGATTGGNSLGLDVTDGNLVLVLLTASWTNDSDDVAVTAAVQDFFSKSDAYAASRKQLNSYKYLNYAYKTQQPIQGYGAASVAKLQAASRKYDPYQVFQNLVPGGFKLFT